MEDKPRKIPYKSDLSDDEWKHIQPLLPLDSPQRRSLGRHSKRELLNAIFYVDRTGIQWEFLPRDFPPKSTVFDYFTYLKRTGAWDRILEALNRKARKAAGRDEEPSLGIIDSQSAQTAKGGEDIGYDGHKKVKGRKRHIVTDILGLLLAVQITAANVPDGELLNTLTQQVCETYPRLACMLGDGGYGIRDYPEEFAKEFETKPVLEISSRPPGQKGFVPIARRWRVERTFAWFGNSRRLSKDYERTVSSSEAWVKISAARRTLRRLSSTS